MGFDNECILNIQSLAGEYFCPVCRLLVYPNEALQSQCTHLYCKPCLTYIVGTTRACPYDGYLVTEVDSKPLIESNKALAETIGKIAVHCLYHRSGCTWQGPLSECSSHCSGCAFGNSPVVCNRCGIQIVHRQVQEHAQNCPGMQPQAQQTQGVQDAAVTGTAAAADQSQSATLSGTPTSQAQTLQTTAAPSAGHDPNQQTNANPQAQAVAPAAVPTPEQWYQQQYQQYYQQYPGYDPYQQTYQNYYPYQQQAIQQYQQHPQQVQVQPQPQVYAQPQPQHQPQPQPQSQPLPQPQPQPHLQAQQQVQAQSQSQPQPQPQPQPQVQPQPHQHFQAPVAAQHQNQAQVNPQQQLHPAVQPHAQMQTQTHPPPHGQPHPQQYPQAQPHPQQHVQQMPQYQLPNSQMQPPQPQVQLHPHSAVHSQPHSLPQSQPPSHSQAQPQALLQHHPHPQLHPPQPSQPPNLNTQTQTQHPSGPAVTGHHSFPQPQALSQMQSGAPQQHPAHILPQSGPLPQHPTQIHSQFPQQPPQMRPPQSHAPVPNQQQPAFLPPQGQVPSIPSAQQQPIHPHAQQPGHSVHQRPVMQPIQSVPQQYVQQQPFPLQTSGTVQNQLHQQGHFVQQQLPMQSQSRPPGPPHSVQQNSHAYLQPQQNVAHGMQPHQSQNYVGRPMMPNHGAQSHSFPQSPGGFSGAAQVRPMQLGANQPSTIQNYLPRTNSQLQTSSEQLVQAGLTSNPTVFDRQGDHTSEKSVAEREAGSPSQRTAKTDANVLFPTSALRADIVEVRTLKSETDGKSMDTEQNPVGGDDDNPSQVGTLAKDADSESHATENGSGEPAIKPMGKKECTESGLPSPGGKSIEIVVGEQKDAANVPKVDHSSVDDTSLQQTKSLDEQSGKMPKVAMDAGRLVSTGTDKGSQAVPPASAPIPDSFAQNVALQGNAQTPLTGRDPLQHGYQERNLSQSQLTPQVPGVDEFRGFPPHGQVPGKGFGHPAPIPLTDQGRHHQPPMQYGPSTQQHRPAAPSMLQSVPPPGPPHHAQVPGQPPTLLRPQGPGNLPQAGQPLNPPEHFQPPAKQPYGSFHPELSLGGIPGPGSSSSFGRGPSHFGPPQRSFELQSSAPQGHYNQGHVPPPHAGLPRISQGEPPVGGVPQGPLPPGSSVLHGGIMGRAPPHGPEGQFGQQRPINPMETEIFLNQRSRHFDGRQHDSLLPGTLERGPFGQPPGIESNAMRMNGAPGLDSTSTLGFRDERFRPLTEEHLNPFPLDPAQRHDQGEFEEDLKQFPRHSHLDSEPVPKLGSYFSTSRPIDRGPHGFIADATSRPLDKPPLGLSYDAGMKLDPVAGGAPSRFLPPYHGILHPNDTGERAHLVGPDDIGRADISRTRTDFPGPIAGFGRHHMDHRSPGRENPGVPTRGFGGLSGGPRNQSGLDDIDGRESRSFSEGSRSVNLPSDPVGNSFFESRFPVLPSHLRRGELDGPGNFRGGDLIGQDSLPSHFRRGELLGPRNLPGHLRMGEPTGFGAFPGHGRMGELAGPGNFPHHLPLGESFGSKSSHPQLGEPGFRSSYSLQGFPNDGGFYKGGMDSFGNSRKRKPVSMGWCRICKVDCETVEGLDLHSQTREHQNKTMDMVRSIKQQNAKKQKTSNVHASLEEAGKSRSAGHEGRGNKA